MAQSPSPDQVSLYQQFEDKMRNKNVSTGQAVEWFKKNAKILEMLNRNAMMSRNPQRLVTMGRIASPIYTGRMIMFFYQPKYRNEPKKLPYYDRFPLVIIIKTYPDGFLGLNLHYLPIQYRAKLLNKLHEIYKTREYNEKQKLIMNWQTLKNISGTKYFKPCTKRYLYHGNDHRGGGVTSKFNVIDPNEWDKMISLPVGFLEDFARKTATEAQNESIKSLGIRKH